MSCQYFVHCYNRSIPLTWNGNCVRPLMCSLTQHEEVITRLLQKQHILNPHW